MQRREYLAGLAGAGGIAATTGCLGLGGGGGSGDLIQTKLAEAFYPTIPQSVQTQVGIAKGIFQKHGVEITDITSFQGGGTTVRGITTGGLGAGGAALAALVQAYMAGAPIHLGGLLVSKTFTEFQAPPDSDVESIMDVKGGTIAVTNPGSTSEAAAIRAVQNTDGLTLDDVTIQPAGGLGEAITLMNEGQVDVAVNFPPRSTIMRENGEAKVVWKSTELAPNIMDRILLMGAETFEENPELAQGLGHAFVESMRFVRENIEESAQIYADNNDLPEGIPLKVLREIKPQETYHIEMEEVKVKTVGETMIEQGLIDEQPPWSDIIKQSHLPEDNRLDWV